METCPHGLTTHCALCMNEGKGTRPSAVKVAVDATEMVLRGASKQLDLLAEIDGLRQQLAESQALVEYLRKRIKAAEEWQAARSALVAVVLPEKQEAPDDSTAMERNYVAGWNDYDSEVRRLNAVTTTVQELTRLRGCEQDAARYRWLRKDSPLALYSKGINFWKTLGVTAGKGFDAEVDAAIHASQGQGE